jgi:hypothetical protein
MLRSPRVNRTRALEKKAGLQRARLEVLAT